MTAYYYITSTTDLVRTIAEPLIKFVDKQLCSDYEDFLFGEFLRYARICKDYPTAKFVDKGNGVQILVDGVMVYECVIIAVDNTPVEIPDED